jgi:hypothetical protein
MDALQKEQLMEAFIPLVLALVQGESLGAALGALTATQWVNIGLAIASDVVEPAVKQDFITFMSKLGQGQSVKDAAFGTAFDAILAANGQAAIDIQDHMGE